MREPLARAVLLNGRLGLRDSESPGLRVLLLPILVHHDHFDLVLAGRKPCSRRREGKSRSATAWQLDRVLRPFFAGSIFRNQTTLHLNFSWRITNRRDRIDDVVASEGTGFRIDALILSYLQAADIGRRGAEFTSQGEDD